LRITIYVLRNEETGLGHFHRMGALTQAALDKSHEVTVVTDGPTDPMANTFPARPMKAIDFELALDQWPPDWVVIDLPDVPERFVKAARAVGANVCLIDGVGHAVAGADLVISQGLEGEHRAPDYLLLRRGAKSFGWIGNGMMPLVWGGGSDVMGLVPAYCEAFPDGKACILPPRHGGEDQPNGRRKWVSRARGEAVFGLLATCGDLITAMGMICWEAAAIGTPMHVFSCSERHLKTARGMEELGLLRAWPMVGLPEPCVMKDFLSRPFMPTGLRPDGLGARRVVELLEKSG
jgi:hypothetical protein